MEKLDVFDTSDYVYVLLRLIRYEKIDMIKKIIKDRRYEEYTKEILNNMNMREKIVNCVLKRKNENLCDIMFDFFDIKDDIPDYDDIEEIKYVSDENCLINTKKNIFYIFNGDNYEYFEKEYGSMKIIYELCENEVVLDNIVKKLEENINRRITDDERKFIIERSEVYRDYIDDDFRQVVNDIKSDDPDVDSKGDCYNLLYEILGRNPSKWEVEILWKSIN